MVWSILKRIFGSPTEVTDLADIRPGKVIIRGTAKADGDLVRSPLKGLTCVAFYYRAAYKAQARGKWVDRVIKEAEVYAPKFAVELSGGKVTVVPAKPGSFDAAEHRSLMGGTFMGFHATEQVIRPGDRVVVHGRAAREGDEWRIRPSQIELPPPEEEKGPYPLRPRGRKKRRR